MDEAKNGRKEKGITDRVWNRGAELTINIGLARCSSVMNEAENIPESPGVWVRANQAVWR